MNQQPNILFAGDPHGDFCPLITAVHRHRPQAVIMLGDYDLNKPLEHYLHEVMPLTDIWWIAGNHDFQSKTAYDYLFRSSLAHRHLHLKVIEIGGVRIAGLSGIFLGRVWYPPQAPQWLSKHDYQAATARHKKLSLKYHSAIWHNEVESLKKLHADILVTHEAPRSHPHGFSVISELAVAMRVKYVFHGHLHEHYRAFIHRNIKVCGVADRSVVDLSGKCL
jgi:predicted phosphodiesterase